MRNFFQVFYRSSADLYASFMAATVAFVVIRAGSTFVEHRQGGSVGARRVVIRWDVLIVGGVVVLFAGYLLVQLLLRFNAARLLEARRVARRSPLGARNLFDLAADARHDKDTRQSHNRRQAL